LGQLGTFLVFVQEQQVGLIRHPLNAPGTPDAWSHTCLVNVRTVHSGKYRSCI